MFPARVFVVMQMVKKAALIDMESGLYVNGYNGLCQS